MAARGIENSKYQGSKWIRRERRLAIYLRDGMACAYCGSTLEDGTALTLDHIIPYCQTHDNKTTNLITACQKCNSARGNRNVLEFAEDVAEYLGHGITKHQIINHITECVYRGTDIRAAKEIINRRGSWTEVLKNGGK